MPQVVRRLPTAHHPRQPPGDARRTLQHPQGADGRGDRGTRDGREDGRGAGDGGTDGQTDALAGWLADSIADSVKYSETYLNIINIFVLFKI